ncbi:glucosamine-6-phosphate deaminase [Bacillus sp. V3-13]|uniref:glucosamine-6-phosphate deaminase n=1 Tax=Bacillus sp. V3-13 TaxID=2053728 RepID=UPI000C76F0F7|nr:glucosamine-6-phosphate deaminase [Bacillus sp. V3-13]PLR75876.1 glucosamine-6-phosphate deaminase [Bacillus sp. V3-13]
MKLITVNDYEELSRTAGEIVIENVNNFKTFTLGLATGSTPEGLYRYLAEDYLINKTTYQHVKTFNLDEYVGLGHENESSYHYYMNKHLFSHIDILTENIHLPNGINSDLKSECSRYESSIEQNGHIDLQILGLGRNGHIGFNEPGTLFESKTHVVELANTTRMANSRFFSESAEMPTHAITMGISTILKSREILLLVSGVEKAQALHKLLEDEVCEAFPASILKLHPNVTVIADKNALSRTF